MSKVKEDIAKRRLKLTANTLRVYNEKYMKGEIPDPFEILHEVMLNAPRDSDRVKAATEIVRMMYQRPPSESEVQIIEDAGAMDKSEREELSMLLKAAGFVKEGEQ